jgi:PilZ domain
MQTIRAPRFHANRPLTVTRYWEDTPVRNVAGRCRVVNENGLGAEISDQLWVGEVVRLELSFARGIYATVRNARGNRYGMEFLCLTDNQHKAINRLCEACALEQTGTNERPPEVRHWR